MTGSSVTTSANGGNPESTITTNYAYDPTGIRVQQTVKQAAPGSTDGSTVTQTHDYLIDTNNPTGY